MTVPLKYKLTSAKQIDQLFCVLKDHVFQIPAARAHRLIQEAARRIAADRPSDTARAFASLTRLAQNVTALERQRKYEDAPEPPDTDTSDVLRRLSYGDWSEPWEPHHQVRRARYTR